MEPLNFIYWLQGYLELQDPKTIDGPKVQMIKDHLGLVLNKKTPGKIPNLGAMNFRVESGTTCHGDGVWKSAKEIEEAAKDAFFSSGGTIKFP
jgi:hypothetical protein